MKSCKQGQPSKQFCMNNALKKKKKKRKKAANSFLIVFVNKKGGGEPLSEFTFLDLLYQSQYSGKKKLKSSPVSLVNQQKHTKDRTTPHSLQAVH